MRKIEVLGRTVRDKTSIAAMKDENGQNVSEDLWHTITQIVRIRSHQPKRSNFFTSEGKYITTHDDKIFNHAVKET